MQPKLQDLLFEHFRQSYQFQLERIEKLRDRISFVVALLSILGSVLLFLITNYAHGWHDGWCFFFYVPAGVAGLLFLISAGLLLWVIGGRFRYEFIPDNPLVQEFAQEIVEWTTANGGTDDDAVNSMKEQLLVRYRDGGHFNFRINRTRTDRLILAQRLAVFAFLFAFVSVPRYFYDESKDAEKPVRVLLVSDGVSKSKSMPDQDAPKTPAPAVPTQAKPAPSAPPQTSAKPVLAPNQLLSEGSIKMETRKAPPVNESKKSK